MSAPSASPSARRERRVRLVVGPPADEHDDTAWLTTFADLSLQLFAFVLLATVLAKAHADVPPAPPAVATAAAAPAVAPAPAAAPSAPAAAPPAPAEASPPAPAPRRAAAAASDDGPPPPPEADDAAPRVPAPVVVAAIAPAPDPVQPSPAPAAAAPDPLDDLAARLRAAVGDRDDVRVATGGGGVVLSMSEAVSFPSSSAALLPSAVPVLAQVRALAERFPDLQLEVAGHTDDRPIRTARYPSNLELSLARAASVARAIAAGDPELARRTVAVGHGDAQPAASNADADGRARNRRVDVRLVPGTAR